MMTTEIPLVFDLKRFLNILNEQIEQGDYKLDDKINFYVIDSTGKEYSIRFEKNIKTLFAHNDIRQ